MADDEIYLNDEARVDAILRSMDQTDMALSSPPGEVWSGIVSQLDGEAVANELGSELAPVVALDSRRRPAFVAAAVAAALVIVAGLAFVLTSSDDADPIEVASAELVYVDDDPGFVDLGIGRSVGVTLLEESDSEVVRVDTAELPGVDSNSDLEIWLIGISDGEIEIIQTLGLVDNPSDPGDFTVPADFDRTAYDAVAVDISIEPHDGDKAHSGMSLVRGLLT